MDKIKESTQYFKGNKGYNRLIKGIRTKYVSLGEIKGNVNITNPTKEERQALSGLMKKDYSKNKTITVNLKKLQDRLNQTKYEGVNLLDIIDEYFKEEIATNKEIKEQYEKNIEEFFKTQLEKNLNTKIYKYLEQIIKEKNKIFMWLKKQYNIDKKELEKSLQNACNAINNLPKENTRIPIFASQIAHNPHEFDRNKLSGKILITFLSYMENQEKPTSSEEISELYYKNKLLIDDASNMVLCKNIEAVTKNGEEHQGLKGFNKYNEPIYLNIYNLSNIKKIINSKKQNRVLVVENPSVFMALTEQCKNKEIPLVCTYGQVKLSGIMLLDLLVQAGHTLYYSGDIDPEGVQIADKLKQRYGESLNFVGFDVEVYNNYMSNVCISDVRLKKLDGIASKELKDVCDALKLSKMVAYEEENIKGLVEFVDFRIKKKGKICKHIIATSMETIGPHTASTNEGKIRLEKEK